MQFLVATVLSLFVAFSAAAQSVSTDAPTLGVRGVVIGQPIPEEHKKRMVCKLEHKCVIGTQIGERGAQIRVELDRNKNVDRIEFAVGKVDYQALLESTVERFGKPTKVEREVLQNGYGATFEVDYSYWVNVAWGGYAVRVQSLLPDEIHAAALIIYKRPQKEKVVL